MCLAIESTKEKTMEQVIDTTGLSSTDTATTSKYASAEFFEFLWRTAGVQAVGLFVVAYAIYGYQPGVGASADALAAFYGGHSTRILIAAIFGGMTVLNLMWFAAALRATLADVGRDGWGAAATTASAVTGGLFLLLIALGSAQSFSIAASGNQAFVSGLNDLSWAIIVLSSFARAMLIMSGVFGLWRANLISNGVFALGVVGGVVLELVGGMTWIGGGLLAPDGIYNRFVTPFILVIWVFGVTKVLLKRRPANGFGW
jgi:hypothetical protein